jgi:biotin transport system substrate-specific component
VSLSTAISLGVTPFLVGDLLKVALAAGLFPLAWRAVEKFTAE